MSLTSPLIDQAITQACTFAAKTMRRLNQCHRHSRANRAQGGNLSELGGDGMFTTFH